VDAETQKDDNIIEQEEKNQEIKENNEVKDGNGNEQNLDITNNNLNNNNNNLSNILNNLDIANLVKSQSYLTSLPLSITHKNNKQIQLNGEKIEEVPGLLENAQSLAMGLVDCMMILEQNEKLMCPISDIDDELKPYINNEDLTGLTLMHDRFCSFTRE
jgi:hypothetical protein